MSKLTSIKSVIFDVSSVLDVGETQILIWATSAYRKMELPTRLTLKRMLLPILDHKVILPDTVYSVAQVFYTKDLPSQQVLDSLNSCNISSNKDCFIPMRLSTSNMKVQQDKRYTYEHSNGCLTTSIKDGYTYVAYLTESKGDDGLFLIPDDETLKDALYTYCMYKYYEKMYITNPTPTTAASRDFYLSRFQVLKTSAIGNINYPSEQQLNNIMQHTNTLFKHPAISTSAFSSFGLQLTNSL